MVRYPSLSLWQWGAGRATNHSCTFGPARFGKTHPSRSATGLLSRAEFRGAGELDATFAPLTQQPPEALVVMSDAALYDLREPISALALKHRLPAIAYVPEFTDAGALMSYGPPRRAMYHRAAGYVKKILTGAKPADLPVEQPTQVELSINLPTAKALGITIPDTVLARADRVIE
jgi:putative tryptophan/tyrosine transport system substrate-binding protein